jgi:CubicO group peptidase (beta-lactamase class C family)
VSQRLGGDFLHRSIHVFCLLLLPLLLVVCVNLTHSLAQQDLGRSGELAAKVDAYVKPFLEMKAFSGSILIAKQGRVLLNKGYGMANYELDVPNTPQTKFHIASISKTFTATAILILQERGLMNVRDPLSKYIPDYPNGDKIMIHHLLTHTSGIPDVNQFLEYNAKSKFPQTPASLIELFKQKPLAAQPGERYLYSNSNYNLLAFIIEKVSGKGYGEFLSESIFDPLGMKDTAHDGRATALLKNRASGYVPAGVDSLENAPYLDWTMKTGNGSLYSTVEDLYKWDRALYTERILKRSSLAQMFTKHVDNSVGYGWFISRRLNRNVLRMNGRSPGFQGEIHRYVDDDVCVIVLSNNYSGTASFMIADLAAMAFGEQYEAPPELKAVKLDPKELGAFVGKYQSDATFFRPNAVLSIEKLGDHLTLSYWGNEPVPLKPLAGGKFYDRTFGASLTFVKSAAGETTHFIYQGTGSSYELKKVKSK